MRKKESRRKELAFLRPERTEAKTGLPFRKVDPESVEREIWPAIPRGLEAVKRIRENQKVARKVLDLEVNI